VSPSGVAKASRGQILAFDTATTVAVVALGDSEGRLLAEASWTAGYRHGEELLTRIDRLLSGAGMELGALAGIVVGTGPGAFTGLRVGLATAKGLAHALSVPLVGVATSTALLRAAASGAGPRPSATGPFVLLLPAGPSDRVLVAGDVSRLVVGGTDPEVEVGATLVAVDERIAAGATDDLATLVPEYVTLPRGVRSEEGTVEWSRDPR
jgi:hypothetical protein